MPASNFYSFSDPYAYQAAVRAGAAELVVTGRGTFEAELTRIDFDKLWMQRGYDSLPRVANVTNLYQRHAFFFLTGGVPSVHYAGRELMGDQMVLEAPQETVFHRTDGPSHWGSMSLMPEDLAAACKTFLGREPDFPRLDLVNRPSKETFARMRQLHAAAAGLARVAPNLLTRPGTIRYLEQALVRVIVHCLAESAGIEDTFAVRCHATVMARFERVLGEHPRSPLCLADICSATGVSERTLRVCCNEHLGMGPTRFLHLRRLHLVRRALQQATPEATNVTDVAGDYGFWELGRFAGAYRSLFGELPSATLRRPAVSQHSRASSPFDLVSAASA